MEITSSRPAVNISDPNSSGMAVGRSVGPLALVMFAVVVLVANAAGVSNDATALGASVFFFARVAHAIVYAAGWPVIRPLFFFAGLYGIGVIAVQVMNLT